MARNPDLYDRLGEWIWGSHNLTTRPENRITYMDRIVALDSQLPYSQIVTVSEKTGPINARFPIISVAMCRTVERVFIAGSDFVINDSGQLVFTRSSRPALKTRLSIHYDHHPQFLVQEHIHSIRDSMLKIKDPEKRQTPVGTHQTLPIQALVKLEHLVGSGEGQ